MRRKCVRNHITLDSIKYKRRLPEGAGHRCRPKETFQLPRFSWFTPLSLSDEKATTTNERTGEICSENFFPPKSVMSQLTRGSQNKSAFAVPTMSGVGSVRMRRNHIYCEVKPICAHVPWRQTAPHRSGLTPEPHIVGA